MLKEALGSGGAERQLALLMEYLPAEWERAVWTMGGGPFVDVLRDGGYRVRVAARRRRADVRPALDLWRLLLAWRPDVVHSWDWMSSFAAVPICRVLGIPIVDATIRNGMARRRRSLPLRAAHAAARRVVANSRAGLTAWGIAPAKGRVIYNAFDPGRWPLCLGDRQEKAGQPAVTAVMTARMMRHKDFAALLAVARELDAERPGEWRFVLVGEGPDKPILEAQAGALLARGVVAFAAPGLEVLPHVGEADIGVLLTNEALHREGCANAIMEYMACALPVVCTSGGGNPELVEDGVTGILVPFGDREALAGALRRLAADREAAAAMGAAGRRRLRERFTVEHLVHDTLAVYREALT